MANAVAIPEARTDAALEYMAEQLADVLMAESVSGERVAAVLKQAGSDLVGWSKTGKLFYRAQQKVGSRRAAVAATATLERMEAQTAVA